MNDRLLAAIAALRVGMNQDELAKVMRVHYPRWNPPGAREKGHYVHSVDEEGAVGASIQFIARITADGRIGRLGYYGKFPGDIAIDGWRIGMARKDALARMPNAAPSPTNSSEEYGHEGFVAIGADGTELTAVFQGGRLLSLTFALPGAIYPGEMLPEAAMVRKGLNAYDLEILHRPIDTADNKGWVFGLPPGITPRQWPLDPVSGYPLMHGFTLLLPEDYRVHGPDIVALSFFATAADQADGGASPRADLEAAVLGEPASPGEAPGLKPFREHAAGAHPRLYRMTDVLDYAYAVILLNEAEFRGAPCQPPLIAANSYLNPQDRPAWMTVGGGYACFESAGGASHSEVPVADRYIYKVIGAVPEQRLDWHRALNWTPRANDPNAGIPPAEVYGEPSELGYQSPYDRDNGYQPKPWAKDHKSDHIGGTMRPVQGTPEFSPFYLGFEEYFGGYNFGSGNAQLDFLQMRFDWACG